MRCGRCKEEKPESEFYPSELARGSGWCRDCHRERARRAHAKAPAGYRRAERWLFKYGLTEEVFAAMLAAQGGRCAICGTDEPGGRNSVWHVDHDHHCCPGARTCGKCIRGLLCQRCNIGLGYFSDNQAILESAIGYLEKRGSRALPV